MRAAPLGTGNENTTVVYPDEQLAKAVRQISMLNVSELPAIVGAETWLRRQPPSLPVNNYRHEEEWKRQSALKWRA